MLSTSQVFTPHNFSWNGTLLYAEITWEYLVKMEDLMLKATPKYSSAHAHSNILMWFSGFKKKNRYVWKIMTKQPMTIADHSPVQPKLLESILLRWKFHDKGHTHQKSIRACALNILIMIFRLFKMDTYETSWRGSLWQSLTKAQFSFVTPNVKIHGRWTQNSPTNTRNPS